MPVSPTLRQRKLARSLKQARIAAGLSVAECAKRARLQPGTISKIENERQSILARTAQLILQACGVGAPLLDTLLRIADESETVSWWLAYSDSVPDWFRDYVELESDTDEIWTYSSELVDGLLQTPAYATAITKLNPDLTTAQLERAVSLREARQAQLDRNTPPRLRIVLNEAVLRRPVGGPEVMREQIRHLAAMSRRPNIDLRVLPFSAGAHPGMKGSFTLLRFPGDFADMDCVYVESETGAVWQERPGDIGRYTTIFEQMVSRFALPRKKTTALLDSLGGDPTCEGEGSVDDRNRSGHPLEKEQ
jgi:transcriptional regulator with XRE-family HTH domain